MPIIDQRVAVNRRSTPLHKQLAKSECAALVGHLMPDRSHDLQHHRRSVEAHLQLHQRECLSSLEQQLIQQSPGERELSKLISGQPAEII